MKEPTREDIARGLLDQAHDRLNRAAVQAELCHQGNEARFLIGRAMTLSARQSQRGVLGRWHDDAVKHVRAAQAHLRRSNSGLALQAMQLCDDAVLLLEQAGKLRTTFGAQAEDREAALRFFGNARVANNGRGHGVPLKAGIGDVLAPSNPRRDTYKAEKGWTRSRKHGRGM